MWHSALHLIHTVTIRVNPPTSNSGFGPGTLSPFNDLAGMITNLGNSLNGVYNLVAGLSYIAGIWMVVSAIYKMRKIGDHQQHMFNPTGMGGPMANLLLAVGLIWWPTMLDSVTYTLWGTTSPLGYTPAFANDYQNVWTVITGIMKIVGLIAFVRGWYLLSQAGEQHSQGMITKGLTHIVGGIFAYHIEGTLSVLMNTFGFNWS